MSSSAQETHDGNVPHRIRPDKPPTLFQPSFNPNMLIQGLSPGELPKSDDILHFFLTPGHKSVYDIVYAAERLTLLTAKDNKAKLVSLRVLGYLVLLAPGPDHKALAEIATAVRTTDSSDIYVLGGIYSDCFVRSCELCRNIQSTLTDTLLVYKFKGSRTPFTPSHPSRPSFNVRVQEIKATILQAPKNHSEAKDKVGHTMSLVSVCCRIVSPRLLYAMVIAVSSLEQLIQSARVFSTSPSSRNPVHFEQSALISYQKLRTLVWIKERRYAGDTS